MRGRSVWFGTALAFFLALRLLGRAAPDAACPAVKVPPIALPNLRKALNEDHELTVVALGSSSTEGSHASDAAHTYPAILQAELSKALPRTHLAVLNRGVGGQDAAEELARLQKDALALAPTVVIWQVGANGALRGSDPAVFKHLVDSGVRELEANGTDVILMDNQRSPAILASPAHAKLDRALAEIAKEEGAPLFARGRLMDSWQEAGHPYTEFLADDGIHHNDRGYLCVAKALARAIVEGLGPSTSGLQASR